MFSPLIASVLLVLHQSETLQEIRIIGKQAYVFFDDPLKPSQILALKRAHQNEIFNLFLLITC